MDTDNKVLLSIGGLLLYYYVIVNVGLLINDIGLILQPIVWPGYALFGGIFLYYFRQSYHEYSQREQEGELTKEEAVRAIIIDKENIMKWVKITRSVLVILLIVYVIVTMYAILTDWFFDLNYLGISALVFAYCLFELIFEAFQSHKLLINDILLSLWAFEEKINV